MIQQIRLMTEIGEINCGKILMKIAYFSLLYTLNMLYLQNTIKMYAFKYLGIQF
jgi:hypothetical protein